MPKISIVVPVYRVEKYIGRCIDSILAQTFKDFELILVDDGSPDNSGAICDEYALKDCRTRVIHKENGGVSTARNIGIKEAEGVWITFVDSDDWVDKTYLEDFHIERIEDTKTMVFQGITFNPTHVKKEYPMFKYDSCAFDLSDQDKFCRNRVARNGCPVAKLFNKQMLTTHNLFFDSRFSINEDHLFITQCLTVAKNIVLLDRNNYHYYFEYGAMSLTRCPHPADNLLQLSSVMTDAFMNLCMAHNYVIERFKGQDTLHIFGIQQILRAAESAIKFGSKEQLRDCCKSWNSCKLVSFFDIHNIDAQFVNYLMRKELLTLLTLTYKIIILRNNMLRMVKKNLRGIIMKFR